MDLNVNSDFSFLDRSFNNMNASGPENLKNAESFNFTPIIPDNLKKVYEGYDIYSGINGWQRDYIYYNITPSNTKGPFNYNFKEHLVGFEMLGDPRSAINKIADQTGDPMLDGEWHDPNLGSSGVHILSPWTDGEFEFKVKVYYGTKNPTGNELITYKRIKPSALYSMYKQNGISRPPQEIQPDYNNKYATDWYKLHIAPLKVN